MFQSHIHSIAIVRGKSVNTNANAVLMMIVINSYNKWVKFVRIIRQNEKEKKIA